MLTVCWKFDTERDKRRILSGENLIYNISYNFWKWLKSGGGKDKSVTQMSQSFNGSVKNGVGHSYLRVSNIISYYLSIE